MASGIGRPDIGRHDAIILAGGRGSRLGGIDKPALTLGGRTLLVHALDAVAEARRISVVRPVDDVPVTRRVSRTVERPQWAGPAAAIAAGLDDLARRSRFVPVPEFVFVIASDLPRVGDAVAALRQVSVPPGVDGLMAVDGEGRDQPLLAAYRVAALRAAVESQDVVGLGVSHLIAGLAMQRVPLSSSLCADIDDADDAHDAGIDLSHSVQRAVA